MTRRTALAHEFVEYMPDQLKDGVLYVSILFATVAHKCCCGCGQEVVTPLSPTDWKLIFDGRSISLDPSIGNWSLPCKSHYWIRSGRVRWAGMWTHEQIENGRAADRTAKEKYFSADAAAPTEPKAKRPIWSRLKWW
jgi:Family of unknown function (DUF6527)